MNLQLFKPLRYLLLLPILIALLAACLFLPDAFFLFFEREEDGKIYQEDVNAIDLILTPNLNIFERMQLASLPETMILETTKAVSDEEDIQFAAENFVKKWAYINGERYSSQFQYDNLKPYLFTHQAFGQSAVFWEASFTLDTPGETYIQLTIDDETHKILQVYLYQPEPFSEIISEDLIILFFYLQESLNRTIIAESIFWDIDEDMFIYYPDPDTGIDKLRYMQYTLHVTDETDSYQFVLSATPDSILFNIGEYDKIRDLLTHLPN